MLESLSLSTKFVNLCVDYEFGTNVINEIKG